MAAVEALSIPVSRLGGWLSEQHLNRLHELLKTHKYEHILKKYKSAKDLDEWYEGELTRLCTQLRDHLDTPKEGFYRQELEKFRSAFHKPVIYAAWDWEKTVADSLYPRRVQRLGGAGQGPGRPEEEELVEIWGREMQ